MVTKKRRKIDGQWFPWTMKMGNSEAMRRLQKNSDAINVLMMFINKWTFLNAGENLCVTYGEAKRVMSSSTFAKAKLWCCALGFLYCREFGRLERRASIYDLITKWNHLSEHPEKLDLIERLLKRHERILRIQKSKIKPRNPMSATARRHQSLRWIEKRILAQ